MNKDDKIKNLTAELSCLKSENLHTMNLCGCLKSYKLTRDKVCKDCRIAELEAELAKHEWVSVEDRPPEKTGYYQVVRESNNLPSTRMFYAEPENFWESRDVVLFWKPISLPPADGDKSGESK
jgi:hypothetical protein